MLYDHAHAMQVKLCKANTRGVIDVTPLGLLNNDLHYKKANLSIRGDGESNME